MRWERLFDDLEAQLAAAERDDLEAEVADRTRREVARVLLSDRVRASHGASVDLQVQGVGAVRGVLERSGPDWLLLDGDGGTWLVVAAAVDGVSGLATGVDAPAGEVASRLGLAHVLRGFARDRSTLTVLTRSGNRWVGTVDRVGADHFDLAEHEPDAPRRPEQVRSTRVVTFDGLAAVSSR